MAVTKEAIAIILDVGLSMHEVQDSSSILENAKTCINMIFQRKIFSESKDELALILLGADESNNKLFDEGNHDFKDINVLQDFKTANWELLEEVEKINGTKVPTDYIKDNALLVAIDLLQTATQSKKVFSKRILFLSRFDDSFCSSKMRKISEFLKAGKIDLNLVGPVSFSVDINNGSCMQQYPHMMQEIEINTFKDLIKDVNGESYTFEEALPALIYYQKKKVNPTPWNATLDIGTNLTIPISTYIKVSESKPKSWKNAYGRKLNAKLEKRTTFLMNDEDQTKVSKDNIVPAFKYGTTLVPFTDEDKLNMDYQSGDKGMKVLGFTKAENVKRYHYIGDKSTYVFGQKNRELAGVILAPFIQALHDTKMVAIVRYVYSARTAPKIGFLSPKIKPNYECLIFITLPFMEDLRHYIFSPLDSDSKNLPTDEQLTAVDDLINAMDLSTALVDEDGNVGEALKPKNTVNPYLQRLYQCLQHRALFPEKPLPEISPHIEALINPPTKLVKMAEPAIDKIKELFPLKGVSQKKGTKRPNVFQEETDESKKKPKLELADMPKLSDAIGDKILAVGSVNPVQDFQYLLKSDSLQFGEVCKQVIDVVYKYLKSESNLKHYHSKIVSICEELHGASLKKNDAAQYNVFMKNLRNELLSRDLELWEKIRKKKLGLLSSQDVKYSAVSVDEAENFLTVSSLGDLKAAHPTPEVDEEEDDYELLGQL